MEIDVLHAQVNRGSQSLNYLELVKLDDHKLRIEIKSDTYRAQCYARVSRHDGTQWHHLHDIPSSSMSTPAQLIHKAQHNCPEKMEDLFMEDRNELLRIAELILD